MTGKNLKTEIGTNWNQLKEINAELMKRAIDAESFEEKWVSKMYRENRKLLDKIYINLIAMMGKCDC